MGKRFLTSAVPISLWVILIATNVSCSSEARRKKIFHAQGEMAGEPTVSSVILQSRLTATSGLVNGDVPGAGGFACFEISKKSNLSDSFKTGWEEADGENDFIVKQKVNGLSAGTTYYYRLVYGVDKGHTKVGDTCTFKTLEGAKGEGRVSFVVVTGMNYHKFHHGSDTTEAYTGADKDMGYPGLERIAKLKPDFFVGTGDNVYFDHPRDAAARTQAQLRKKYHEQFVQRRFGELFSAVPTYWEKDDHDFRYDDADNTGRTPPSPELGSGVFLEQLPVIGPGDEGLLTYRTHRVNKLLQIWLVEGRDYRSPNNMPDGPGKSIWGDEQKEWLKKTLLESDATFKILISPTPMVGPDDMRKRDNHTNPRGFRYEGEQFFEWLGGNGFLEKGFYIVCGDRHWQYHSVHPTGFEEFSCGALVDANARIGRSPGDPQSTDPDALIKQPYIQPEASGGFLHITVTAPLAREKPYITFQFYDEKGTPLYRCKKPE